VEELVHNASVRLFALDEMGISLKSCNFYGWSPVGQPHHIESNGSHKGWNILGATEILKEYKFYYRSYASTKGGMKTHYIP
jgi:hypothetical protein